MGAGPLEAPNWSEHLQQGPNLLATAAPRKEQATQWSPGRWASAPAWLSAQVLAPTCCVTTGKALGLSGPLFSHLPRGLDDVDWYKGLLSNCL